MYEASESFDSFQSDVILKINYAYGVIVTFRNNTGIFCCV